jgi:hypothetical protein
MSKLLFLPLDVEVLNTNFELGETATYQQNFWETKKVLNVNDHQYLLDQFSLDNVTTFTHKIQQEVVKPHVDLFNYGNATEEIQQILDNEPSGFHVVLKGNVDSIEVFDGKRWINPILPKVPMAYLMNLTTCYHRVKEDHMRETLYIKGFINKSKHVELINKSLEKYSHLAVYQE